MDDKERYKIADTLEMMLIEGHYKGGFMCLDLSAVYNIDLITGYEMDQVTNYIESRINPHNVLGGHLQKTKEFGIRFSFTDTTAVQMLKKTFWYRQVINELRGLPVDRWESRWSEFSRWVKFKITRIMKHAD